MRGNVQQIAEDIMDFEKLGVNQVNLVFDFGNHSQDLKKRLGYTKQIRDAIVPSVLTEFRR